MPKHIRVSCPGCQKIVRVRPEYLGEKGTCRHCGHYFRVREYEKIICPGCTSELDVRKEYLGKPVKCKQCQHSFIAKSLAPPANDQLRPSNGHSTNQLPGVSGVESSESVERSDELGRLKGHVETLRARVGAGRVWRKRANLAEEGLELARRECERSHEDVRRLEAELEEARADAALRCDHLAAEAGAERERLRAAIVEAEARVESLRLERDNLICSLSDVRNLSEGRQTERLTQEETSLQVTQRVAEFYKAREQWNVESEHLRNRIAEADAKSEELRSERDSLIRALNEERGIAEASHATRLTLENALTEAEHRGSEFNDARIGWDAEREALRAELDSWQQASVRDAADRAREAQHWQKKLEIAGESFERDLDLLRRHVDVLQAELEESRSTLAEAVARRDEAIAERETLQSTTSRFYAETTSLREELDREKQELLAATERMESTRRDQDEQRLTLERRLDQVCREADEMRRSYKDASKRAQAVEKERNALAERLESLRLAKLADEQRVSELSEKVDSLESLKERVQAEHDSILHRLAEVQRELEAARNRPVVMPQEGNGNGSSADRHKLAEALSDLRTTTERANRLEAELRQTRSQSYASHLRDLALDHFSLSDLDDDDEPTPAPQPDAALLSAQRQITELSEKLQRATKKSESLEELLTSLGIRP